MGEASELVLSGFALRADAKVVKSPDRYLDKRGETMWLTVQELMGAAMSDDFFDNLDRLRVNPPRCEEACLPADLTQSRCPVSSRIWTPLCAFQRIKLQVLSEAVDTSMLESSEKAT